MKQLIHYATGIAVLALMSTAQAIPITECEGIRLPNDTTDPTTPLRMDYSVREVEEGIFDYEFTVTLDNNDGSWQAGQGWGWLIFGDAQEQDSPLTNFVGDLNDLPIGPWDGYGTSFGHHNGPTLQYVLDYWVPTRVGEMLTWSGTSNADLRRDGLTWSCLVAQNDAQRPDWTPANLLEDEPSGLGVFLSNTPTSVDRGTSTAFRADVINEGEADETLDEATMTVTGPVGLERGLYDGGDLVIEPRASVGGRVEVFVPRAAPVGQYRVEVSISDDGEMLASDGFDVSVE